MKQPSKLTRDHKFILSKHKIENIKEWGVISETPSELIIYNRNTNETKVLKKGR